MKIDKSKLMKRAWEIAEIGFLNAQIKSLKGNIPDGVIKNELRDSLAGKRGFLKMEHVSPHIEIAASKRDFLAESMRIAWTEAKADLEKRIEAAAEQKIEDERAAKLAAAEKINKNAPRRELVPADKYVAGETLGNFIITGLGREFRPHSDMFSLGITPDTEFVQYAYFN